jgi:hypothetical protein
VLISDAEPSTSTVVVTSPTCSFALTVACSCTASVNLPLENFLNPCASATSTYVLGGSAVTTYRPLASASALKTVPRCWSVTRIFAPATVAPDSSETTPLTLAVNDCAKAIKPHMAANAASRIGLVKRKLKPP